MSLVVDLRTWLLADGSISGAVGANVHYSHATQAAADPYIWYVRSTIEHADGVSDAAGTAPIAQGFDIEVYADTLSTCETVADAIRAKHLYRGTMGDGTVQGVFVEEQSDDYTLKGISGDEVRHAAALRIMVYGYTGA